MVRVCCLYRVSLLRQVDHVESNGQVIADIPMQKEACRHFCQQKQWSIVSEIQEQGISGYKNPTFDRAAVQEVLAAARAEQFDILLVYTLDRLSRRDSELPLLLSEITECGVAVWSVQEGEMKYQTSTDRLLAYLYGWKANGESERISQRISTVQEQMTMRGQFRGGAVPFGYKLVETGEISKQGRKKHSLAIHEPEAEIVRFIFDQIDREHITMYELTKQLAAYSFRSEVRLLKWRSSTLHVLLRNPIYIGCYRFNGKMSLPFVDLQIIEPDQFQRVQKLTRHRGPKRERSRVTLQAAPLYHDILFCGHCGTHLVFTHALSSHHKEEYNIRYLYRCYNKERFVELCDGSATYSAIRIDQHVHAHMNWLCNCLLCVDRSVLLNNAMEYTRHDYLIKRAELRNQLDDLLRQEATIKKGIAEAICFYGVGATTELQLLSNDLRISIAKQKSALEILELENSNADLILQKKQSILEEYRLLCEEYQKLDWLEGERLVAHFFERIDVYRDYAIRYTLREEVRQLITFDAFPTSLEEKQRNALISCNSHNLYSSPLGNAHNT